MLSVDNPCGIDTCLLFVLETLRVKKRKKKEKKKKNISAQSNRFPRDTLSQILLNTIFKQYLKKCTHESSNFGTCQVCKQY